MMGFIKRLLSRIYYFPDLSKEKTEQNQLRIRDTEWESIKRFIPGKSTFLDVGCGAGNAMLRAKNELDCDVWGIDPEPGQYGVGRNSDVALKDRIVQAFSEKIPFPDAKFDVVYSSHVLEHVTDVDQTLGEIRRVMKDKGVLIIGMPTAAMAVINFITQLIFRTHSRIVSLIMPGAVKANKTRLKELIPGSHSHAGKSVFFDMRYYKVKNWHDMLSTHFRVEHTILPLFYSYPETRQLFKPFRSKHFSSSVFFICYKK